MQPKFLIILCATIIISLSSFAQSAAFRDSVINSISKLSFLTGHWEGTIQLSEKGKPIGSLNQILDIVAKNDGTIIQLDASAKHINADGTVDTAIIRTMQIFSYEPRTNKYLQKYYGPSGKQMEEDITVLNDHTLQYGFNNDPDWGYARSTITVQNNKWTEVTEFSKDGKNWETMMKVNLEKK